jgi:hypothetical protein
MPTAKDYIHWCVTQLSGAAVHENTTTNRVVLRSAQNPETVHATIDVTLDGVLKATVTTNIHGVVQERQTEHVDWKALPEAVLAVLPEELFCEKVFFAVFNGERGNGTPMTPAHGNSLAFKIVQGEAPKEPSMTISADAVSRLFDNAAIEAIEFVAPTVGRSAQICARGPKGPVWVNIDHYEGKDGAYISAETNDRDFMVGYPPSFWKHSKDPAEIKDAVVAFFTEKFAGVTDVTVQVFRREGSISEPVREGNSQTIELSDKPEHLSV